MPIDYNDEVILFSISDKNEYGDIEVNYCPTY